MTALEALTTPHPVRLSVSDFMTLDDAGAFTTYGKAELIDGTIYVMNAQYRPHARAKAKIYDQLREWAGLADGGLSVLIEATVAMPPHDAPEPDLVLTSEPDGDGPVPAHSVALIVEIADTTQRFDLGEKARLYAANAVAEYWVVDLKARIVHQLWETDGATYTQQGQSAFGVPLTARTLAGLTIDTTAL